MFQRPSFEITTLINQQKGLHTMQTLLGLLIMFFLNGIGAYIAYRVITWFETGRTEVDSLRDFKPNVRKVK
jgi:hypothetical protein